jgi:lipoprotein signal peptidase
MVSLEPGLWIAAILSMGYLSVVVKDNVWYRVAVETLLGASVGNWVVTALLTVNAQAISPLIFDGEYLLIFPILLGIALLLAVSSRYGWVSRYGNAWLMGVGCGISGTRAVASMIVVPIADSILTWNVADVTVLLGRIVLIVSLVTTLLYFLLTIERKGYLARVQQVGRYFIMLMMGIFLPTHQNWNIGAMQQMLQLLMHQWLGVPEPI